MKKSHGIVGSGTKIKKFKLSPMKHSRFSYSLVDNEREPKSKDEKDITDSWKSEISSDSIAFFAKFCKFTSEIINFFVPLTTSSKVRFAVGSSVDAVQGIWLCYDIPILLTAFIRHQMDNLQT